MVLCKKVLSACIAGVILSGCTALHTDYQRPDLDEYVFVNGVADSASVTSLTADAGEADSIQITDSYWVRFEDDKLTALIEEALENNNDYYQALINVRKAMVQADIADAELIPDLSASLSSGISKPLKTGVSRRSSDSSLKVSYELDLFGRLAADSKAAAYDLESKTYDARAARLSVSASVANVYWQIVYYKDAIRLSESNLKDSEDTFAIMKSRYDNGSISELELLQAKTDLIEVQTTLAEQRNSYKNSISAMNMLLNKVPTAEVVTADTLEGLKVPEVRAGLGSDLLSIRPDVASAEAKVKSALASKDAARLDMYPRFSLTAGLSAGSSSELVQFFENPVASILANLALPFINYYKNSLQIDLAELSRDSAEMNFVTTYYKALGEVYQALNDIENDRVQLNNNIEKLQLTGRTEELYRQRYEVGAVSLKDYLEARKSRRVTALTLAKSKQNSLNDAVVFAKALGGL
ncbi:MAG: efflux transporter outer membrane subunit [Ruminobacter sp.]|uniref:TolC family protein n=1 Tax=Ruminobacter sp. TaxID=2774296 RepID=UPI001B7CA1BA|nr:efflux transporter outer membrane subunit [Ruminobacter sp.]MBP3747965.1 efflux transporter outer membrane subunit [Ruminobacter sp.]